MNNSVHPTSSIAMGLDAIFSAGKLPEKKENPEIENQQTVMQLPISQISASPFQARKHFSDAALSELATSITQHGILQPLIVRPLHHGQYELLAGERRLRAAQQLHLSHVPAIICAVDDVTAMAFGLIENIQRQNLNVIEEAKAYERLLEEFQLSHDALSEKIGKSRSHITNLLRLNRLPDAVKKYVINDDISMGHARAILSLPVDRQTDIVEWIIHRGMSVRQTEDFIKRIFEKTVAADPHNHLFIPSAELKNNISVWKEILSEKYTAQVKINCDSQGRARVVLEVESEKALQELMEKLT